MNGLLKDLALRTLVVLILMVISLPIEAMEKENRVQSTTLKDQQITVSAINSDNNYCGNRMGGFAAMYRGKAIRIVFAHEKILAFQKGLSVPPYDLLCSEKLIFLNKPIDVFGHWAGKENGVDQFEVKKIFIP